MNEYPPYESREEHDMIKSVSLELRHIEECLKRLREALDSYATRARATIREDDE